MTRVAAIGAGLAIIAILIWRMTSEGNAPAPTAAARHSNETSANSGPSRDARSGRPAEGNVGRRAGASGADEQRDRPSLAPRRSAVYAAIGATPEEIRAIDAIDAETNFALDHIPDDVTGDDRVNAVLEAERDRRDKLAELLGDRRANWYLKLRADELEPEVHQLLMPPADDAGVAEPQDQGEARP